MDDQKPQSVLNIPTAIVLAGAIIAVAVIWNKTPTVPNQAKNNVDNFAEKVRMVTESDHILGNPNAKIKIIEYSDPSCPFCKVFHNTMKKVMDEYGTAGSVAWVYRHYPLDKADATGRILHPNAGVESQAFECAADQGGNEKFWKYTNRLYEITPSVTSDAPGGLNRSQLPVIAKDVGLNVEEFNNCLAINKFKERVESDFTDGVNIGIQGTPTSIIVLDKAFPLLVKEKLMNLYEPYKDAATGQYPIRLSDDSKMIMIGGAMPIDVMRATIDLLYTY